MKNPKTIYFNVNQVAKLLELSIPSILHLINNNELSCKKRCKKVKISYEDILTYLINNQRKLILIQEIKTYKYLNRKEGNKNEK